ncbi:MAG: aminotransferase class V-fold PLP-dependent enzyme [candidate division Zixibacteria bacterium]|nr:aminotransferase class V-fold PLP-dependent enzyme [candidate division Zixibacteria bacterium]
MSADKNLAASIAKLTIDDMPQLLIGADTMVPTLSGPRRYINFDNAASTPTFTIIADEIIAFLRWYSNVHRGTGFKSQLSSWAFGRARDVVAKFVGADLETQITLFTKNSTDAINKAAHRLPINKDDIILTTLMEHHSNELPWRRVGEVHHVELSDDGSVSKEDFLAKLEKYGQRIKLVAITGASNVTGYINDLDFFARETHRVGAKLFVDGAQLIPHRPVDMKPNDPEHRIDFLVFSAHKMYAPFGVGVLIGDRAVFEEGDPEMVGGGVVDMVTLEDTYWADLPDKEEAGTPDIIGVVALAKAVEMFQTLGWESIINHESELAAHALRQLREIPGVNLYGDIDPDNTHNRLGVIAFNIDGLPNGLVAAVLNYEGAIGVRPGCFCAHMYVKSLLRVTEEESIKYEQEFLERNRSNLPGAVRASFGIYNTMDEVDIFVELIKKIAAGDYKKDYRLNREKGTYAPRDFQFDFEKYYSI